MLDCIFCKIAKGEVKKEFTHEDENIMVFPDISPIKPVHLLVVPKKHIPDFLDLDKDLGGKIIETAKKMVRENDLIGKGYRILVNGGGAQHIDHLHIHIFGPMGQKVGW